MIEMGEVAASYGIAQFTGLRVIGMSAAIIDANSQTVAV
jgi:hypothetical protein